MHAACTMHVHLVAQVALPPLRATLRPRHLPIFKLELPGSAAGTPEPEGHLRPTPQQLGYASAGPSRSHSVNPLSVRMANDTKTLSGPPVPRRARQPTGPSNRTFKTSQKAQLSLLLHHFLTPPGPHTPRCPEFGLRGIWEFMVRTLKQVDASTRFCASTCQPSVYRQYVRAGSAAKCSG